VFDAEAVMDQREQRIAELERMVGRLTLELDMAKKAYGILTSRWNENEKS
jgi:hypothetical protein